MRGCRARATLRIFADSETVDGPLEFCRSFTLGRCLEKPAAYNQFLPVVVEVGRLLGAEKAFDRSISDFPIEWPVTVVAVIGRLPNS